MNFTEVKSILESVSQLVKKAATLDLQEKIVELREYIISLKDENISLKEENHILKLRLENEQQFSLKKGLYWKEDDEIPFCQKCLDGSRKRIHLQAWADGWKCFECDKYYAPEGKAGREQVFRPELDRKNPAR
jgi:regulator of replication initiation timing